MDSFTYQVDRQPDRNVWVVIKAHTPAAAATYASNFGQKHGLMLIGPIELAQERIYR